MLRGIDQLCRKCVTHLVLINSDEEAWGSLAEKRGFAHLDPRTARLQGVENVAYWFKRV